MLTLSAVCLGTAQRSVTALLQQGSCDVASLAPDTWTMSEGSAAGFGSNASSLHNVSARLGGASVSLASYMGANATLLLNTASQ